MSIIYKLVCSDCGNDLNFSVSLDSGDDLNVEVEACSTCIQSAVDVAVQDVNDESDAG